ncbi:MAG: hypothetical protein CVV05_19830 [Gammaproteobacteria bacterium HGW-Gammaproteobacteria-1]|nr:MAG: hypothetical protein CVV05_19830 [Gammaproteobacteria bacterium HGW-Gammaproteobacteria-1]
MKRQESEFASPLVEATGRHLGALVRQARVARNWTMAELAERARVSLATLKRGLMSRLAELRDPASEALLNHTRAKRPRGRSEKSDLDF